MIRIPSFKPSPRQRRTPGAMNKLEEKYSWCLEGLKRDGQIVEYYFEPLKLKLAKNTFYQPDFLVVTKDGMEIHEVKGHWEDDARVKFKVAAEKFWFFYFVAITEEKKRWKFERL